MSNKKQTAVEWLVEQFDTFEFMYCDRNRIIKQAKKLENELKIEMFDKGFDSVQQLNDEYAIEFAEWFNRFVQYYDTVQSIRYYNYLNGNKVYTNLELLQIFKKEKGL